MPSTSALSTRRAALAIAFVFLMAAPFVAGPFASVAAAAAHPVSLLWAQVQVHKDRIDVELITTVEEFYYVYELPLNDVGELAEEDIEESRKKYEAYLLEHLSFRDAEGEPIAGEVVDSDLSAPELGLPMEREVKYRVRYPLELPPIRLAMEQSFGGKDSAFPAVMTVEIEQVDYTLPEPFLLEKGATAEIEFDWLAAPLSEALEDPETLEQRRTELLGITSFGSIYTFFYVEETEVRHEILMPVATLETWLPIEREKATVLTVDEQQAAADAIFEFFAEHNPVTIDGLEVRPKLERMDFFDLEFKDLAQKPPSRPVPVYAARVGVILEYPTKGVPNEVEMTWDLFSRDVRDVRTALIAWETSERVELTKKKPTLEWKNPGRPPLPSITQIEAPPPPAPLEVSIVWVAVLALVPVVWLVAGGPRRAPALRLLLSVVVLAAAGLGAFLAPFGSVGPSLAVANPLAEAPEPPADDAGDSILASLHKNLYRAFDYRLEREVYDALERSVAGDLLADLYLEIRESLAMEEQGGAVSRVQTVEILDTEPEPVAAGGALGVSALGGAAGTGGGAGGSGEPGAGAGTGTGTGTGTGSGGDAGTNPRVVGASGGSGGALDPRSFRRRVAWTVNGTVEHWGHIHSRTNRYEAGITVAPVGDAWKIVDLDLLDQRRVKFETSIRKVL